MWIVGRKRANEHVQSHSIDSEPEDRILPGMAEDFSLLSLSFDLTNWFPTLCWQLSTLAHSFSATAFLLPTCLFPTFTRHCHAMTAPTMTLSLLSRLAKETPFFTLSLPPPHLHGRIMRCLCPLLCLQVVFLALHQVLAQLGLQTLRSSQFGRQHAYLLSQ